MRCIQSFVKLFILSITIVGVLYLQKVTKFSYICKVINSTLFLLHKMKNKISVRKAGGNNKLNYFKLLS